MNKEKKKLKCDVCKDEITYGSIGIEDVRWKGYVCEPCMYRWMKVQEKIDKNRMVNEDEC